MHHRQSKLLLIARTVGNADLTLNTSNVIQRLERFESNRCTYGKGPLRKSSDKKSALLLYLWNELAGEA